MTITLTNNAHRDTETGAIDRLLATWNRKTMLALALGVGLAGAAHAQQAVPEFVAVDTNVDGVISVEEFLQALPDMTEEDFASFDTNSDTAITVDEYEAMRAAMNG